MCTLVTVPGENNDLDNHESGAGDINDIIENGYVSTITSFCTNKNEDHVSICPPSGRSDTTPDSCPNFTNESESIIDSEPEMGAPSAILNSLRTKNLDKPIIGQLNINFLEKKFEPLLKLVKDKIDILMVSETKIDDTYPLNQFNIDGYSQQFRLDRNRHGGGIIIYIRDHLPCKEIKSYNLPDNVEGMFIDVKIGKTNWLLVGGYNPHKESISYFLNHIGNGIDKNLVFHESLVLFFKSSVSIKVERMT